MFKVQNITDPEAFRDILKPRIMPYKLWNHNSFERRPVYSTFNDAETLSYLGQIFGF